MRCTITLFLNNKVSFVRKMIPIQFQKPPPSEKNFRYCGKIRTSQQQRHSRFTFWCRANVKRQHFLVSTSQHPEMQRPTSQTQEMLRKDKKRERKKPFQEQWNKLFLGFVSCVLFFWWLLQGEVWPGLFHVCSPVSKEQTDKPFPKQKDLSHLISHVFSQNIPEFLRPQACCQIWLQLNSEFKSHLGEQKDTQISVTSVGDPRATQDPTQW